MASDLRHRMRALLQDAFQRGRRIVDFDRSQRVYLLSSG